MAFHGLLFGIALASAQTTASPAEPSIHILRYTATAVTLDSREPAFTETSEIALEGERLLTAHSRYAAPDGKLAAESYSSFVNGPYMPDSRFIDHRTGRLGTTKALGELGAPGVTGDKDLGKILLTRKLPPDLEEETETLDYHPQMTTAHGTFFYIRDHLDTLLKDESAKVRMVIPTRLDDYRFRIRPVEGTEPEAPTLKMRVEVDNFFIRLFAPHVELEYDKANRRVIRYRGLSPIRDAKDDLMKVEMEFRYDPEPMPSASPRGSSGSPSPPEEPRSAAPRPSRPSGTRTPRPAPSR